MKIVSDNLLQEKIGFKPHRFQQQILDAYNQGKRQIVVSAGIQSGKSIICAYIILKELLSNEKSCVVIAPSYDLGTRVFDYLKQWLLKLFPDSPPTFQTRPFPRIDLPWNSFVEVKSAEFAEGMLGKGFNVIVVDEASRIPRDVFQQYIYPRISSKEGRILMISTPLKKGDWFYEEFMYSKENPDSAAFQFSSRDNPYFPDGQWEAMQKKLPKEVFDREFAASFIEGVSSVFRNVKDCVSGGLPREKIKGHYHIAGLDLAKAEDFTALVIVDSDTNEVVFADQWQKLPYPAQKERILAITKNYDPCRVIIDSRNVGSMMGDELRREGIWVEDFTATGTISPDWAKRGSKEKLVEKTISFFDSKRIAIPYYQPLIDQLESYSYNLSDFGNVRYGPPSGLHDDLVDALMLAIWGLREIVATNGKNKYERWKEYIAKLRQLNPVDKQELLRARRPKKKKNHLEYT